MKEEILIKKQQEIENARVKDLEINMRDSGEFEEWKREMKEKEELERLEYQQRKKIEMELAREAAVRAQEEKYKVGFKAEWCILISRRTSSSSRR